MTTPSAPAIRVFEPALCCNTGVCGPDVDQALVTFTADLDHLRALGVDIERHNLANDPGAFTAEPAVLGFLKISGSAGLPLTLVDGVTVLTGSYPTRAQLRELAGLDNLDDPAEPASQAPAGRTDLGLTAVSASPRASGGGCCGSSAGGSGDSAQTVGGSGGCCC